MNFNKYKLVKNQLYYKENSNSVRATNVQCIKYFQDIGFVDSRAILCHYCMCPWMTLLPLNVKKKSITCPKNPLPWGNARHILIISDLIKCYFTHSTKKKYSLRIRMNIQQNINLTMARLFHKWLYFYIHINRNFFFINCWTKKSFPYILNWFSFWVKKKYQRLVYNKISCSDLLFSKSYQHMNKPEKWT